jgi:hypothetical protein
MLGKLLKYEFKSTSRIFIPFYIALLGVALILKLFTTLEKKMEIMVLPSALFIAAYVVLVIIILALAYVIACTRFYKNLLGDEGYLMHTLPVKPYLHILTKLITGLVWFIASICASLISVLILMVYKGLFADIQKYADLALAQIGVLLDKPAAVATLVLFIVMILVSLVNSFLMFYASMSIGQLVRGHRVVGSIAAYFGLYFAVQIISTIVLLIFSRTDIFSALESGQLNLINDNIMNPFTVFILTYTVMYIVIGVGYYLVANYMLKKKLSLE